MMRASVEVVAYCQGVVTLQVTSESHCDVPCGRCAKQSGCSLGWLSERFSQQSGNDTFKLPVSKPLKVGQRLELRISVTDLLPAVLLAYLYPIGSLLLGAGLLQGSAVNEIWVIAGALFGAGSGWLLARRLLARFSHGNHCRLSVLQR